MEQDFGFEILVFEFLFQLLVPPKQEENWSELEKDFEVTQGELPGGDDGDEWISGEEEDIAAFAGTVPRSLRFPLRFFASRCAEVQGLVACCLSVALLQPPSWEFQNNPWKLCVCPGLGVALLQRELYLLTTYWSESTSSS